MEDSTRPPIVDPSNLSAAPPQLIESRPTIVVPAGTVFQSPDPLFIEHTEGKAVTLLPPGDVFRAARGDVKVWGPNSVQYFGGVPVAGFDRIPRLVYWPAEAGAWLAQKQPASAGCGCCGAHAVKLEINLVAGQANANFRFSVPWRRHTAGIQSKTPTLLVLSQEIATVWERFRLDIRRPAPNGIISLSGLVEWWNPADKAIQTAFDLTAIPPQSETVFGNLFGDRLSLIGTNTDPDNPQSETLLVIFHRCPDGDGGGGSGEGCACCEPEAGRCNTPIAIGDGALDLVAADLERGQLILYNEGVIEVYVCAGEDATAADGIPLEPGEKLTANIAGGARLRWSAICATGETTTVRIAELRCEAFPLL